MTKESYHLTYQLEKRDLLNLRYRSTITSRVFWLTPILLALFAFLINLRKYSLLVSLTTGLVVMLVLFLLNTFYYFIDALMRVNKVKEYYTSVVSISLLGVSVNETGAETNVNWSRFQRVERDKEYIRLYSKTGGLMLFPKRAFEDPTEMSSLFTFIQRRLTG